MMTQMVLDGRATIGVSGPLEMPGIERVSIDSVKLIPVAAGRNHIQLVLTDRLALTRGRISA